MSFFISCLKKITIIVSAFAILVKHKMGNSILFPNLHFNFYTVKYFACMIGPVCSCGQWVVTFDWSNKDTCIAKCC